MTEGSGIRCLFFLRIILSQITPMIWIRNSAATDLKRQMWVDRTLGVQPQPDRRGGGVQPVHQRRVGPPFARLTESEQYSIFKIQWTDDVPSYGRNVCQSNL